LLHIPKAGFLKLFLREKSAVPPSADQYADQNTDQNTDQQYTDQYADEPVQKKLHEATQYDET
jgi:hypothetical protein